MKHFLIASALLLPAWTAASAQDADGHRVRVGLGAQVMPKYVGADDTQVLPYVGVDIAKGTNEFRFGAPDDGFGIPIFTSGNFSFGPVANIATGRKNKDVGAPVGRVKTTLELGGFAQVFATESIRFRAEVRKGVNGHEGIVSSFGVDQVWRDGDRYVISIGPRVLVSDSRYQRAYFGVTPTTSLATGLPVYRPDGGIHAIAATSGMSYQFSPQWGVFGYGRIERLVGDAAKSPIVREFGSRNQLSAGLGISYTFTVRM
jgi:outer membrane protein